LLSALIISQLGTLKFHLMAAARMTKMSTIQEIPHT